MTDPYIIYIYRDTVRASDAARELLEPDVFVRARALDLAVSLRTLTAGTDLLGMGLCVVCVP
eukprot:COSAG01_NODE_24028_length_793_cov_1.142651_2_plen_62_part_00